MTGPQTAAAEPRRGLAAWLDRFESVVGGVALLIAFTAVLIGIVSREAFGAPVAWSEELARLAFVYVVFIGMSEAFARGGHLRVEIVDLVLGRRWCAVLRIFTCLVIGSLGLFLVWYGYEQAVRSQMLRSLILGWPLSITYAALPIAALLMAIRAPFLIWREIKVLRSC